MTTPIATQSKYESIDGTQNTTHHLVWQIRNARKEWGSIFDNVSDEDGARRFGRINSLSWFMGHLAWHEMLNYGALTGEMIAPELNDLVAKGAPASSPPLSEMRVLWEKITAMVDEKLTNLTPNDLLGSVNYFGFEYPENLGSVLQRVNNHYFFHMGEAFAVRQLLDHKNMREVMADEGAMDYYPEQ